MKKYAERDLRELEPHYHEHVLAMTRESLHAKSDIAAELAYRDAEIERLRLNHEIADRMGWRPDVMGMKIAKLEDEIERLREEVRVLRLYGNKDCTAMADEALAGKEG